MTMEIEMTTMIAKEIDNASHFSKNVQEQVNEHL